ncbi:MAG: glycosyltransferase family 87 protein [Gemmatimonadales bacterium]
MNRSGLWSARTAAIAAASVGIALALAVPVGTRQHVGDDFHVFWQAGHNFLTGAPLYHDSLPGARPLKYPPFAALVFTPLALFPLPIAGVLVSLLNLGLWVAAVYLTRDIVARTTAHRRGGRVPLILGVILSAQYFLDNFHHAQMNEVTLVLVLLAIRAYLDGRDATSAGLVVAATAIKITPVFFVGWLAIRARRRAAIAMVPLGLACIVIPLLLRGPARGAAELTEYYHVFLEKHQHGDIGAYMAGQNVAGLVSRMTQPGLGTDSPYQWLPADPATGQLLYRTLWVGLLIAYIVKLVRLRRERAPITALELAMGFLVALLLSPITFTTHLVPLLFILTAVLAAWSPPATTAGRLVTVVVGVAILICGLSGRDLMGDRAYVDAGGYSVCAWAMLALFVMTLVTAGRSPGADERDGTPTLSA